MRFSQDAASGINLIRSYGDGALCVRDKTYGGALIISADTLMHEPGIYTLEQLLAVDPARVLGLQPELLLLGTGARQVFPGASFSAPYLTVGIGVEVMDTGAACRTYNVLASEQRRAVALLLA